jgi:hypothetical protein
VDPYYGFWIPNLAYTVIVNEGLDEINQIRATADGGYVAVGTNSNVVDNQNALNGGSNIFVLKIDLNGGGEIQTDTVFTLNQLVAVSAIDQEEISFGVHPNPSTDVCHVTATSKEPQLVRLFDQQGSCLESFILQESKELILRDYAAGIYFLELNGAYLKLLKQ